ncbi:MAG TPA: DUF5666 domain-containing protein [Candidatus Baltobacteraceae bacterium]|jgi:hypothetical protein
MASFRAFGISLLVAALVTGASSHALADPPPWSHGHGHSGYAMEGGGSARDRGAISGTVTSVDYSTGSLSLDTPRGHVEVQVTPSTNVFRGKSGYAALTDLHPGTHVQVFVSEVDGRLIAQIIRIH